ncbi:hypothetical protein BH11PSE11_BH11PSE11_17670 [soil metagenome]
MNTKDIDEANNARDDADLEALLQGRGELAEMLRSIPQAQASPELDAAILAHAESALRGRAASAAPAANDPGPEQSAKRPVSFVARWRVPLGLAASLMLGLHLAMMYQSNQESFEAAANHAPMAAAPASPPARSTEVATTQPSASGSDAISPSAPVAVRADSTATAPGTAVQSAATAAATAPSQESRAAAAVQAPPQLAKMKQSAKPADKFVPEPAERDRAVAASGAGSPAMPSAASPSQRVAAPHTAADNAPSNAADTAANTLPRSGATISSPAPQKGDALAERAQAAKLEKSSAPVLAEASNAIRGRSEAHEPFVVADAAGASRPPSPIARPSVPTAASARISAYSPERAAEPQAQMGGLAAAPSAGQDFGRTAGLATKEAVARRKDGTDAVAPPPPAVAANLPQADMPDAKAGRAAVQTADSRQAVAAAAPASPPAAAASTTNLRGTPSRPNAFPAEADSGSAVPEKAASWLIRIEKLLKDDKRKEALEEWKKFRKAYPDYQVATPLRTQMSEMEKRAE